jgi:hypothetical protein
LSVDSLGMSLDTHASVRLWARRTEELAWLVIGAGNRAQYEIRMERAHVEALRDHIPAVLAGLDRWAAEDRACERAEQAGRRATEVTAAALDQAASAEAAGAHELAAALRAAVAEAREKAGAVDEAVLTFETATAEADAASDRLLRETRRAAIALATPNRPSGDPAP